ncbi:MAG TPA: methyltransferase domain-containing protein [Ktedonobacteraceae bacterium]|nr:methyltransferase domain-containing protein [Ktedonobacteraceae bacterium]
MSVSNNASGDENAYFIDAENVAEMARLAMQDRLTTKAMGGLLPEQTDLSAIHDILDIACGPGAWALDMAQAFPQMQVTGIDISRLMVEYAKAQAREKNLHNASFQVMDALNPLEFADNSFDLVNARFITGFMSKAAWPLLVRECMRVLRPGGILRLTECESPLTNSKGSERMYELLAQALARTERIFSVDGRHIGITPVLGRLLHDAGFAAIQKTSHVIDYSFGTEAHAGCYQDVRTFLKLLQPFFVNIGVTTQEEVNRLYLQTLEEMQSEDFCGIFFFLTAWGTKPA